MRAAWLAGLLASVSASVVAAQSCPTPPPLPVDDALTHVRYLADDALAGRDVASPGERCAGEYLAAVFAHHGLEPAGDGGSYFQAFPVRVGSTLGARNGLAISGNPYELGKAWSPVGFSGTGTVEGPLRLLSGGLSGARGEAGDSAARDDLAGSIAVVEAGTGESLAADPHFQASVAQGRGAAAVLVLLAPGTALPELGDERRPFLRIPVAAVAAETVEVVRAAAQAGAGGRLETEVDARTAMARNVVALLPGSDPRRQDEIVVLGAHYDHLGRGGAGSLAPDSREIHNGADDNASGTAALLEAARRLAEGPPTSRPVLFVAFSGEERGLLGSAHFVAEPTVALENAVAMLNMDMVGRLRDNTLTVYGMATADEWETLVERINAAGPEPFRLSLLPDGFGPSDHASFYGRGIPVLHFFTNTHSEYHRPEDDWHTIDGPGLDRIADYVTEISRVLAGTPDRVAVALTAQAGAGQAAAGEPGAERGYGPYFGSIPDMAPVDYGVRLSGVREDSPAERAGLRAGDVLVRFAGDEVADLYGFTYALRDRRPGDRVEVVVLRDGQRLTLYAVLGERR
jgi:aminopeptidase YwaD